MKTTTGSPSRQGQALLIVNLLLTLALILFGLFYQIKGWKVDGTFLVMVGIIFVNVQNYFGLQSRQATARIDELEKKFAALAR